MEDGIALAVSYTHLDVYKRQARGRDLNNPTLEKIASKYEKTVPQIMLRWLIQQKKVVAIPKAKSAEHQKLNFDIFDFQLSSDAVSYTHLRIISIHSWDIGG